MSDELFLFCSWMEVQWKFEVNRDLTFLLTHENLQSKITCSNYRFIRFLQKDTPASLQPYLRSDENYGFLYLIENTIDGVCESYPLRIGSNASLLRFLREKGITLFNSRSS